MTSPIRRLASVAAVALAATAALASATAFAETSMKSTTQPPTVTEHEGMSGTQSGEAPFAMEQQAATASGRSATMTPAGKPAMGTHWVTTPEEVRKVQQALVGHGIGVRVDGRMGPETRAALKYYQSKHDLTVNGRIDLATLESLNVS